MTTVRLNAQGQKANHEQFLDIHLTKKINCEPQKLIERRFSLCSA